MWIQKGKTLVKTALITGETDGINTEILSGLSAKDVVVIAMKEISDGQTSTATSGETSPFMPKRPSSEK